MGENDLAQIARIRQGFPWREVEAFRRRYGFTDARLARLLGIGKRTLSRLRGQRKSLDPVSSDRFYRLRRIVELAAEVLEDEKGERAMKWLGRSQPGLGGRKPIELLDTDPGVEAVERLLLQLEHGVVP